MDTAQDTFQIVVDRAASDAAFRQRLVADVDVTLATEGYTLPSDDLAILGEYCRTVATMSSEELDEALKAYYASGNDARRGF